MFSFARVYCGAAACLLVILITAGCDKQPAGVLLVERSHAGVPFTVIKVDFHAANLTLHWKDADGKPYRNFTNLEKSLKQHGQELLFATNAGIFTESGVPLGLHIEEQRLIVDVNRSAGEGNFYLLPNGVFFIDAAGAHVVAAERFEMKDNIRLGAQSGPLLVDSGKIHPQFKADSSNRFIRSGVGTRANGDVIFVLSKEPVTFYELATFFRDEMACPNALYLDGGISRFHLPAWNRPDAGADYVAMFAITR